MLPDRLSNPGPLTYESGALPIALRGPAIYMMATPSAIRSSSSPRVNDVCKTVTSPLVSRVRRLEMNPYSLTITCVFCKFLTPDGSRLTSSIYVSPYRAIFMILEREIFSMINITPGTMNHFQKWGPCSITPIQNGTYSMCVQ